MSAPVEFFTLRLLPGEIHHLDTLRDLQITNVSYSDPENLKGKKRSVSEMDEDTSLADDAKLSRSQRKRLNKKRKAEASASQPKQDKVRGVLASMLTDVLFAI